MRRFHASQRRARSRTRQRRGEIGAARGKQSRARVVATCDAAVQRTRAREAPGSGVAARGERGALGRWRSDSGGLARRADGRLPRVRAVSVLAWVGAGRFRALEDGAVREAAGAARCGDWRGWRFMGMNHG